MRSLALAVALAVVALAGCHKAAKPEAAAANAAVANIGNAGAASAPTAAAPDDATPPAKASALPPMPAVSEEAAPAPAIVAVKSAPAAKSPKLAPKAKNPRNAAAAKATRRHGKKTPAAPGNEAAPVVTAAAEAPSDLTKSGQPKMKNENPWGSSSQAL